MQHTLDCIHMDWEMSQESRESRTGFMAMYPTMCVALDAFSAPPQGNEAFKRGRLVAVAELAR